jgi:hypothetical protein
MKKNGPLESTPSSLKVPTPLKERPLLLSLGLKLITAGPKGLPLNVVQSSSVISNQGSLSIGNGLDRFCPKGWIIRHLKSFLNSKSHIANDSRS